MCILCIRSSETKQKRDQCKENLTQQAKKMIDATVKTKGLNLVGDNVLVPIPDVDRGRGEFRNIKGIITANQINGCYTIGTKHGILKQPYCRNQFIPTNASLLQLGDVSTSAEITLREVARKESTGIDQGYATLRYTCKSGCLVVSAKKMVSFAIANAIKVYRCGIYLTLPTLPYLSHFYC